MISSKLLKAGVINKQDRLLDSLTARQYGEVVLPDAASGNCPGTPRQRGQETVSVQGGYGVLFAVMVQNLLRTGAVAVQF